MAKEIGCHGALKAVAGKLEGRKVDASIVDQHVEGQVELAELSSKPVGQNRRGGHGELMEKVRAYVRGK
jgi:hypothetical protein